MRAQLLFVLLQVADVATTMLAIEIGGSERNMLVSHFLFVGTLQGLLFSKVLVLTIAVGALLARRFRVLKIANVFYSGVVLWNLSIIFRLLRAA
jgi:hypothetical protein